MWHQAPNLRAIHGFSDRHGGISQGPYQQLNLSQNVGDDPSMVERNRTIALEALGLNALRLARLRQVHSSEVAIITRDSDPTHLPMADALVTNLAGVALVIETADCYPVLLEDTEAGVIAAAHCGWRGTAGRILERTLEAMVQLGARPERVQAAIGPGISGAEYIVNADVVVRFTAAEFPEHAYLEGQNSPGLSGIAQYRVNLERANSWLLSESGLCSAHIWVSGRSSTEADFFSHRRDHGQTGRMWSLIAKSAG